MNVIRHLATIAIYFFLLSSQTSATVVGPGPTVPPRSLESLVAEAELVVVGTIGQKQYLNSPSSSGAKARRNAIFSDTPTKKGRPYVQLNNPKVLSVSKTIAKPIDLATIASMPLWIDLGTCSEWIGGGPRDLPVGNTRIWFLRYPTAVSHGSAFVTSCQLKDRLFDQSTIDEIYRIAGQADNR